MIPKIIHYCWFGRNPLPELAQKCIASWKKFCPDYEIIEWNEDNFDIDSAPLYVRQAYAAKKWAFVTDYVRLYVMTHQGGIYMDTDVEVVKPLDPFLKHHAFSGFENATQVPTGIMACEKGFPLFERFLRYYDDAVFPKDEMQLKLATNVVVISQILAENGLQSDNRYQVVDGFALYPNDYFCPKSYFDGHIYLTENTCTIHHFNSSWLNKKESFAIEERWNYLEKLRNTPSFQRRCEGLSPVEVQARLQSLWEKRLRRKNLLRKIRISPILLFRKLIGEERYLKLRRKILH